MADPVDRRKFLGTALVGGGIAVGGSIVAARTIGHDHDAVSGKSRPMIPVSSVSQIDTSKFPAGPSGAMHGTLLDVDLQSRTITTQVNIPAIDFNQELVFSVPEGVPVMRQLTGLDIDSLVLGDLLLLAVTWPSDYSSVAIDWIAANFQGGILTAKSVSDSSVTGSKMYAIRTDWVPRTMTVNVVATTEIQPLPGSGSSLSDAVLPGQLFHFTGCGETPQADIVNAISIQSLSA